MKFSRGVVKSRIAILILALILMVPSVIGMVKTRVNYDMLTYLPSDMETVKGQNELLKDFNKGAFTFLIFENMPDKDVAALKEKVEKIEHVDTVLWYDSVADLSMPKEFLPEDIYKAFNSGNSTMMAVFFDTGTSDDRTMTAVKEIRKVCGEQCFISGMTALVVDLKDLCEKEEPIYVGLAVALSCVAMLLFLDSWLVPFVFLASIGAMILMNMGSNYFLGEISYITKALSAVLQLAVTMDYSIFLWHSYNEELATNDDHKEAMALAIRKTLTSVVGSSVTTIAGFVALCFMTFTLGRDLGIVMAKGVVLGVIGCVTLLPSLILIFDKPLQKTRHRSLIPDSKSFSKKLIKIFPAFLIIFAVLITPAYYGYRKANKEVYYNIAETLPEDMNYIISTTKLNEEYGVGATHMVLVRSDLEADSVRSMTEQIKSVNGVKYVLSLESLIGSRIPEDLIPDRLTSALKSENWELMLIGSEYGVATDEINSQIDVINGIVKKYDSNGLVIGEGPCTKDMIETTDRDFKVVTAVSVLAIFLIILFVEKSISLPLILISVIELGIFINLGLPHYLGQSMAFITPICISTIQLGATVDYAILMTTRYKTERIAGHDKKESVWTALYTSIPSIIVSGMGLFAATFGVALYSDIEMISSMCMLMARGAVISMLLVIFALPAMFMLFDGVICKTTVGMTHIKSVKKAKEALIHG